MVIDSRAANGRATALGSRPVSGHSTTIALPSAEFAGVARLVVAGVATRLDVGFEAVDDLQLAVEMALRAVFGAGGQATIGVESDEGALYVTIGSAGAGALERRLREHGAEESIDLRTVLGRLVDGVALRTEPSVAIELRVDLPSRAG